MKNLIINYILSRLREASTWRGIIMLAAGTWAIKNPTQMEAIIPVAIAIVGAIGSFMPDQNTKKSIPDTEQPELPEPVKIPPMPDVKPPKEIADNTDNTPTSGWGDK